MVNQMNMKDYLKQLFKLANGFTTESGKVVKGNRALKNFLDHHTCTGVWNGSPRWRRLPSFYGPVPKWAGKGNVPGSVRRARARA